MIGSDNVTITAGFPDVLKKGHRYEASVIADITTVDPNRRSSTGLSINMKTDDEDSTNEDVSQTVAAGPHHYLTVSLSMRDQEGFELVRKIPARLEASMLSQMASQEIPEAQRFENEAILSEVHASGSMLFSAADTGSIVDEDGHVELCWKPNNYESITREGAELIDPKLTLRYND